MKWLCDEEILMLFIPVWGKKHIDYLFRFAIPSLLQPNNLPACGYRKIIVNVFSSLADAACLRPRLDEAFLFQKYGLDADVNPVIIINISGLSHLASIPSVGMCDVIRESRAANCRVLTVMPDTIFGDGSIRNIVKYAFGKPVTILAPHLRMDETAAMDGDTNMGVIKFPVSNAELVSLIFRHPHYTCSTSWCHQENSSYLGGVSLTSLDGETSIYEKSVAMLHSLPTPYLMWFTDEDLQYFTQSNGFGVIDHEWPAVLHESRRLRVIGSSDLFFAVELTNPNENQPGLRKGSEYDEAYNVDKLHVRSCGSMVYHLRSV